MYRRLKDTARRTRALLDAGDATTDWERACADLLCDISFFQHERLIHLLVTLAFALMELLSISVSLAQPQPLTLVLSALFLVLLVPYLVHYYHLENGTQELYGLYDELRARRDACGR